MNKTDVTKVLATGSPKQRILILAEDTAQYRIHHKGYLTDRERQGLTDSFKTSAEIKLYNKFMNCDKAVTYAMPYLKQLQLIHEVSIAYLTGYCLLWHDYQQQGDNYNELLYQIEDKETKAKVLKTITSHTPLLADIVDIKSGKDKGLVEILIRELPARKKNTERYGMGDIIDAYSVKATDQLKEAKALAQAILDYMDEEGFNVKTYKKQVTDILDALSVDRAVMPKFSRTAGEELAGATDTEKKRYNDLMSKYWVFPDPNVEPDPERVEWYKNQYIKD